MHLNKGPFKSQTKFSKKKSKLLLISIQINKQININKKQKTNWVHMSLSKYGKKAKAGTYAGREGKVGEGAGKWEGGCCYRFPSKKTANLSFYNIL